METLTHSLSVSYPVHRLCLSTRWHMYIFRWLYYRWLHSDTSSAADSPLHKSLQGILGKQKQIQTQLPFDRLFSCQTDNKLSRLRKLTLCAVGSGPAWRAHTLPAGRVADAIVTAATGLVTSFPIETCWACCQDGDKQYHYLLMNSVIKRGNSSGK